MSLFRHAPCARPAPLSYEGDTMSLFRMRPAPLSYEGDTMSLFRATIY